jgi:uncharacterized protein YbbC (DUF1343 family)
VDKVMNRSGLRTILGIEKLCATRLDLLRGARIGLVCNQASVNHRLQHVVDLLGSFREINLTTLFGPQHGIRGDVQDNMIETPHDFDRVTGLPVYSLYSETREPTEQMLRDVDVLVLDLQDVGCRIYTFIYTMANCMRAARKYDVKVIVCDRPNPINGTHIAGNVLENEYASFVGQYPLPTRHGLTIGELAHMFNVHWGIGCDLEVIKMDGWSREQWFDETDLTWVLPSPNMPTPDSATVFPGTVHLEGTQMSEGRGTTRPFELVGAPYVEPATVVGELEKLSLPGVSFRASNFMPTFQKHAGQTCGGLQIHVTERNSFEPVISGLAIIKICRDLYPQYFKWKEPPYEYVYDQTPFDVIAGTGTIREAFEDGSELESIAAGWNEELRIFGELKQKYHLY